MLFGKGFLESNNTLTMMEQWGAGPKPMPHDQGGIASFLVFLEENDMGKTRVISSKDAEVKVSVNGGSFGTNAIIGPTINETEIAFILSHVEKWIREGKVQMVQAEVNPGVVAMVDFDIKNVLMEAPASPATQTISIDKTDPTPAASNPQPETSIVEEDDEENDEDDDIYDV